MQKYAVWLTFSDDDERYLSDIIKRLCIQHSSKQFFPHITAYGLVEMDYKKLEDIVFNASRLSKFSVKKDSILQSEDFWKTVFIQIKKNESLNKIYSILEDELKSYSMYEFNPHVSLIYKNTSSLVKQKIIEKLEIKTEFVVSGIAIQEFNEDISKWRIMNSYELQ